MRAEPRRWYLRVCPCGAITSAGTPCAGFPGAWDDEMGDFARSACLGEVVEVEEVADAPAETQEDEREALRDLAGRAARHLRTLPEQTPGRDVALAAELERAAAGSLAASPSPTAGEGRPPRDATDPLPLGRWLIEVCVECGGAVCVTDPPHRREHQSGVCRGFGCGGLRTVEVMPVPGAREEER